jgi:two-component system chemotaxis sensor kinase CheA
MSDMNFRHLLPFYLDETDEQVIALNDALLKLEEDQSDAPALAVAFRIVHTIKGSSAALGFVQVNALTHHLESFFDILRSGQCRLDRESLDLFFRCLDELRNYHQKLRETGETDVDFDELVTLVRQNLERVRNGGGAESGKAAKAAVEEPKAAAGDAAEAPVDVSSITFDDSDNAVQIVARFEDDVPLPDMKARLIAKRLSALGEILNSDPLLDKLDEVAELTSITFRLASEATTEELTQAANMSGVANLEIRRGKPATTAAASPETGAPKQPEAERPSPAKSREPAAATPAASVASAEMPTEVVEAPVEPAAPRKADADAPDAKNAPAGIPETRADGAEKAEIKEKPAAKDKPAAGGKSVGKVGETVRVELERLDHLMNLTGELVLSKSRFVQVSAALRENLDIPARRLQTSDCLERLSTIRGAIHAIAHGGGESESLAHRLLEEFGNLSEQVESMSRELSRARKARATLEDLGEAVHQLTRVCDGLQKGVLDTRMIPIGPLFERFRRVIRDLSHATGKEFVLKISGESTELDKRVVDELADPLVHMVRNAGDHGLETPEERERLGKPRAGTISLSASQSGDRVTITVTDDGRGIDPERIRRKVVENGLVDAAAAQRLSDRELIAYIWHAGLSTAERLTDISGRGVGMDIVRSRIESLNGTVDIRTQVGHGTTFVIRLPLTLAILPSLLVRVHDEVYAIAVDHIREIVEVSEDRVHNVHRSRVIEIRDRIVPIVSLDDVFLWGGDSYLAGRGSRSRDENVNARRVVVLQSADEMIGLEVDQLMGLQEVVLKSLDKNLGPVEGLSGASILGDGRVSLILDVDRLMEMASESPSERVVA